MIYTGIDIIEIDRIKKVYLQYPKRFMTKIFTEKEISYCKGRYPQIAARVPWKSIEVYRARGKAPEIILYGNAKSKANKLGIKRIALSISHSKNYAVASVVAE